MLMPGVEKVRSLELKLLQVLILYVTLVPFYYVDRSFVGAAGYLATKYAPLLLITCLTISQVRTRLGDIDKRILPYLGLIVCYELACLLSLIGAAFPLTGFGRLIYYAFSGVWISILIAISRFTRRQLESIIGSLILAATLAASYGLYTYFSSHDPVWESSVFEARDHYVVKEILETYRDNPTDPSVKMFHESARSVSTMGNPVPYGAFLTLVIPFILLMIFSVSSQKLRVLSVFSLAIVALGLLITFSRGALLSALSGVMLWLILNRGTSRVRRGAILLLTLGGTLLVGISQTREMDRVQNLLVSRLSDLGDINVSQRIRLGRYGITYDIVRSHTLLGIGIGNLVDRMDDFRTPTTPGPGLDTTDNMYLMVVCETGLIGLVMFGLLIGFVMRVVHVSSRSERCVDIRQFQSTILSSLFSLMVNMITWDSLNHPTIRVAFWVVAGVGIAVAYRNSNEGAEDPAITHRIRSHGRHESGALDEM
jgi:hypothetical protein